MRRGPRRIAHMLRRIVPAAILAGILLKASGVAAAALAPGNGVGRGLEAVSDVLQALRRSDHTRKRQRDAVKLMVVGKGPLEAELHKRAEELGIADAVWFTGARSDIPELMRAMDVFVLPSLNEGISNTILEAMASGLAIVAARVGGNPEVVVSGETGTLYDDASASGLFDALMSYLKQPQLAERHGAAGRERVEKGFSLGSMIDNYMRVYRELVV